MKKLIAMLSVVGMAFGLFAANYAISFEEAEQDKGVNTTSMLFTPVVSDTEWAWTTEEALPLKAYGTETKFAYGTGAYARRDGFDTAGDNNNYLPLSTGSDELTRAVGEGNIYLDQLVKFTGFEDPQTNLVAGTKIAVWMSEFENDDESTETNLYVTVGKIDGEGNVEQVALKVDGGPYSLDTWYRLSIKSLGNVFTSDQVAPHAGFLIYVNGQQVGSSDADAKLLIAADDQMDGIAKGYMTKGQLFTAIDDANAKFTSVGYQGIGAIDDIIVDAEGPDFCVETETVNVTFADITGAVITKVVDSDGTVFTDFTSAISVKPGELTVTLAAAEGYKLFGTLTYNVSTGDAVGGVITIDATETTAAKVVATLTVGEADPVDLAEKELAGALDALNEGDMITTILSCVVTNGEAVTLYSITPNTIIARTKYGWSVYVGNYEDSETQKSVGGLFTDYVGAADGFKKLFEFEDSDSGFLNLNGAVIGEIEVAVGGVYTEGNIPVSGVLKAPAIYLNDVTVTLSDAVGAKVMVTNGTCTAEQILVPEGYELNVSENPDENGYYTYTAVQAGVVAVASVNGVNYETAEAALAKVQELKAAEQFPIVAKALADAGLTIANPKDGSTITIAKNDTITIGANSLTFSGLPAITGQIALAADATFTVVGQIENYTTVFSAPADYEVVETANGEGKYTYSASAIPTYTVAAISVANASVVATNKTAGGATFALPADLLRDTEIAVTVTPNANYEYATTPAGWTKNGDGSITTNATVTANLTITVAAPTAAITPVNPGELIPSKTPDEVNANLDKYLKVPEIQGIDAAIYRAMFAAKQAGDAVVIDLKPDVEVQIQGELDAATAAVLAPDETGNATIKARIGLYYGIKAAGEVGSVDTEAVQNGVQATTTTLKITVPTADSKATPFTDKAFFKTICSPKAFK